MLKELKQALIITIKEIIEPFLKKSNIIPLLIAIPISFILFKIVITFFNFFDEDRNSLLIFLLGIVFFTSLHLVQIRFLLNLREILKDKFNE